MGFSGPLILLIFHFLRYGCLLMVMDDGTPFHDVGMDIPIITEHSNA